MSTPRMPNVAGISPTLPSPPHNAPVDQLAAVQDQLAGWISDLTTLHDLTERLARTRGLDAALDELLSAGATLVGAQRGLMALTPADGSGPERTVGLGLARSDLGEIETIPRTSASYARLLDGLGPGQGTAVPGSDSTGADRAPGPVQPTPAHHTGGRTSADRTSAKDAPADGSSPPGDGTAGPAPGRDAEAAEGAATTEPIHRQAIAHPDIAADEQLHPLHRQVATRLGLGASYAVPLTASDGTRIGAAVWLYDGPAEPNARQRHLLDLYLRCATEQLARDLELTRARTDVAVVYEELLPTRLPRVPGVRLAVRHRAGPAGGGDWYDALALPEDALGLSVGRVTGSGPATMAAMGRLRAALRAYAVMEGEDPVAVLSDLELLLRLTEPARTATALFGYAEPAARKVVVAGAGHCPPLITGTARTEYAETTLSAPLGMLACWEAPSVEVVLRAGETLLLYTDGLLHRISGDTEHAFTRLRSAAVNAPSEVRDDPNALVDHLLRCLLPEESPDSSGAPGAVEEDVVLLAAHFS